MLVDANLLLYATSRTSRWHEQAREWLTAALNGRERVGLPWQSLAAFLRISTNQRASERPLGAAEAWAIVEQWLEAPAAWIPQPGEQHAAVLGALVRRYDVRGNLVPDAQLAALAYEHGLALYSTDTDFARFAEIRWENPLRP